MSRRNEPRRDKRHRVRAEAENATAKARPAQPTKGRGGSSVTAHPTAEKLAELAGLSLANGQVEVERLEAESDEGNVEYKLKLHDPNPARFQQLVRLSIATVPNIAGTGHCPVEDDLGLHGQVTQMKFRLSEGNGECFYYLGAGLPRQECCSYGYLLFALLLLRAADNESCYLHMCFRPQKCSW